jgi:hypothetical protein
MSLVPVDIDYIERICKAMLLWVAEQNKRNRAKAVSTEFERLQKVWFGDKSVEKAEANIARAEKMFNEGISIFDAQWLWEYAGRVSLANTLLKACKIAEGDVIFLSLDKSETLSNWEAILKNE